MARPPSEVVPLCPRCGYDQSGACGRWAGECPLEGTCPECGLRFDWADAFDPMRKRLPWLFEHKPRMSLGLLRAWRSWLRTLAPPVFWRSVTPAHGTSWVVLLWPVALLLPMAALGGAVRAAYLWLIGWQGQWTAWGGGPPRGWALARAIIEHAWVEPFVRPGPGYWWRYATSHEQLAASWCGGIAAVLSSLVVGLTLMSLTSSRRICGVKTGHIVRAMTYRLAPLGAWCIYRLIRDLIEQAAYGSSAWYMDLDGLWLPIDGVCLLWGAWWWATVLVKGWKMPRAWLAAAVIALLDVLAGVATYAVLSPFTALHVI